MRLRIAVSLLCWLSSGYALYLCASQLYMVSRLTWMDSSKYTPVPVLALFVYPWVALAIMNLGWIRDRQVHWWWVASGTLLALAALLLTFGIGLVFAPLAVALAVYLAYFHLRGKNRGTSTSSEVSH